MRLVQLSYLPIIYIIYDKIFSSCPHTAILRSLLYKKNEPDLSLQFLDSANIVE